MMSEKGTVDYYVTYLHNKEGSLMFGSCNIPDCPIISGYDDVVALRERMESELGYQELCIVNWRTY